jgi:hypothetical protein
MLNAATNAEHVDHAFTTAALTPSVQAFAENLLKVLKLPPYFKALLFGPALGRRRYRYTPRFHSAPTC